MTTNWPSFSFTDFTFQDRRLVEFALGSGWKNGRLHRTLHDNRVEQEGQFHPLPAWCPWFLNFPQLCLL